MKASKIHGMMVQPSLHDFQEMVHERFIQSCLVTTNDVTNAYKIFGLDPSALGKTIWRNPMRIEPECMAMPTEVFDQNNAVTLTADIMFINQLPQTEQGDN